MNLREQMATYFWLVEDTRNSSYIKYKLSDILFLLICGIICGCENAEAIIQFGEIKNDIIEQGEKNEFERTNGNILLVGRGYP